MINLSKLSNKDIKILTNGIIKNTFLYNELFELIKDRLYNGYEYENSFISPILNEN